MSITKYPMTVQGARALEEEHLFLSKTERPRLSQAIGEARELGDLKENAEYHAAREEQGMVEARIRDIEGRLQNAVIIDVTTIEHTGKVIFGTTVEIANCETDESVVYQIVGEDEADIKQGKISIASPIARSMIGKSAGVGKLFAHAPPSICHQQPVENVGCFAYGCRNGLDRERRELVRNMGVCLQAGVVAVFGVDEVHGLALSGGGKELAIA